MDTIYCQTDNRLKASTNFEIYIIVSLQIVAIGSDNCSNGDKLPSWGREGGWGDDLKCIIQNMKYGIETIKLNLKYKKIQNTKSGGRKGGC